MSTNNGNNNPIGVFDSGIGGLSVLQEIHRLLPHEDLIYVGDSAHAPYGDRSAEHVRDRSQFIADFLLDQHAKAIVIACNTATAEAASVLRDTLAIDVIGMEPAIKPAAELSKSGVIGVLATQRTINSERLLGLTERYANDKKVLAQACPGLVEQVEHGDLNSETTDALLKQYIEPLLAQGADALILGCTHYPFLLPAIRKITGNHIEILETGRPVASQLKRVLEKNQLINYQKTDKVRIDFYNSSDRQQHHQTMQTLWDKPIKINCL
ncbi:MAG TPA: glutamate racemase [Leucothrix mucor]|nr:glutamate racemase [Leucothrix mucor]